jgi:hypothetical protein
MPIKSRSTVSPTFQPPFVPENNAATPNLGEGLRRGR